MVEASTAAIYVCIRRRWQLLITLGGAVVQARPPQYLLITVGNKPLNCPDLHVANEPVSTGL